jgi:hypothetical protein
MSHLRDYWWMIPVAIVFATTWVFSTGYVLYRHARQQAATAPRRARPGRYYVASLLSCGGCVLASGALYYLFLVIGKSLRVHIGWLGCAFAVLSFLAVGYLVLYAALNLPPRKTLGLWARSVAICAVLGVVLGVPSYLLYRHIARIHVCDRNIATLYEGIKECTRKYRDRARASQPSLLTESPETLPPTLGDLPYEPKIRRDLTCPCADGPGMGYFYLRPPSIFKPRLPRQLVLCDFRDNHGPDNRGVLFADGSRSRCTDKEFQELLARPENATFAAALRQVEGQ